MCGYLISLERETIAAKKRALIKERLLMRGPDDYTEYSVRGIEAFHSRLAIQESIEHDQQPYLVDKRYLLVYNGEIYNYVELRADLKKRGVSFLADGDTEVLARGLALEGEAFISKLNGMFSFVFLDLETRETLLCRDRLGIKPLYYSCERNLIASTNAALVASVQGAKFNEGVLREVLNFRYELDTNTSWESIFSLAPGRFAKWRPGAQLRIQSYWSISFDVNVIKRNEANEKFQHLLDESIYLRTRSKRPITSLLSSGLDSSYLTLRASELGKINESYTLELEDNRIDVDGARSIAQGAGIHSNIISARTQDENFWPELWDQALARLEVPVVDTIIGPTHLLFENIAKKYSVALSGEGADELLAGYVHFALLRKLHWLKEMGKLPSHLASLAIAPLWKVLKAVSPYPGRFGIKERIKLQRFLKESNPTRAYEILISIGGNQGNLIKEGPDNFQVGHAQLFDLKHWLPQYTLRRLDSLSASHGVEARVPYLDHRLVEHVFSCSGSFLDGPLGDKSPLRYAHYKKYKDYNVWKTPKTPFLLSPKDYFNATVKALMLEEIQRAMKTSEAIQLFCVRNEVVALFDQSETLSPLESKVLFSAYLTARWMKIQSEQIL